MRGGAEQKDYKGDINGGDETGTFRMTFLENAKLSPFPVEGCSGQAETRTYMLVHFWHRHVRDTVLILAEGTPPPLPR